MLPLEEPQEAVPAALVLHLPQVWEEEEMIAPLAEAVAETETEGVAVAIPMVGEATNPLESLLHPLSKGGVMN